MSKQIGARVSTVIGMALLAGSLGVFLTDRGTGPVHAAQNKGVTDDILKIADSIKKGLPGAAKAQAAALANKVVGVDDVMDVFKPRKKNGLGVGKKPGAIVPDGIE